mmetsp:Transcript_6033/g.8690  ORF Transcript_6033/g.8690 Transcript_6033/m.8690 type:complete len:307 (+) Transcript_6033:42-962(+)
MYSSEETILTATPSSSTLPLLPLLNSGVFHRETHDTNPLPSRKRRKHTTKSSSLLQDNKKCNFTFDTVNEHCRTINHADSNKYIQTKIYHQGQTITAPNSNNFTIGSPDFITGNNEESRVSYFRPQRSRSASITTKASTSKCNFCYDCLFTLVDRNDCSTAQEMETLNDSNMFSSFVFKKECGSIASCVPIAATKTCNDHTQFTPQQERAKETAILEHNNNSMLTSVQPRRTTDTGSRSGNTNSRINVREVRGLSLLHDSPQCLLSFLTRDLTPLSPTSITATATERFNYASSPFHLPDYIMLPQF